MTYPPHGYHQDIDVKALAAAVASGQAPASFLVPNLTAINQWARQAYHRFLHARMRVKAAGGNPNVDAICERCRRVKPRAFFRPSAHAALGVRVCLECAPYERGPRG